MKIVLDWIADFVEMPALSPKELASVLTRHTAEVEGAHDLAKEFDNMVLGVVKTVSKHPGADRLNLVSVDVGKEAPVQIVCGGQNLRVDMKVAVALPGAWVKWHGEGDPVQMQEAKIRGEKSIGMICAGEEIGLPSDNPAGASEVKIHDLSAHEDKAGTPLATVLGKTGIILEVDNKSLTHRPDLWGHYGMAREFAAIFNKPLKDLTNELALPKVEGAAEPKVDIVDTTICSRFSSAIMSGIVIQASPKWMQARLTAAGMNSHNNIVDITNYVMLELGQPMHAYDRRQIDNDTLRVRLAKNGEKLLTLEGGEHELHAEDPLICDGKDTPVGIAGIKGGMQSGIAESTSEIILEAACFDAVTVRKSALRHNLRTDASQRFEKTLDPALTETAIKRAIHWIKKLCPEAKLIGQIKTCGTWTPKEIRVFLDPHRLVSKIGVFVSVEEITEILRRLDFTVNPCEKGLEVLVPSHRASKDVSIEEDLVEEIARMVGYDNIPALMPELPMKAPTPNEERRLEHDGRHFFAGLGFTEMMNYSFYGKDRIEKCGILEKGHFKILNALSMDQTLMRTSLTPNLLMNVASNIREHEELKLFELGHTYKDVGHFMPLEEKRVTVVVAQKTEPFFTAKGAMEAWLAHLGLKAELRPSENILPYAHPKKTVDVWVENENIGVLFTVHPQTLEAFDIASPVSIFSLNLHQINRLKKTTVRFKSLAKFPGAYLDFSVLLPEKTFAQTALDSLKAADQKNILIGAEVLEIYRGKNLPEGQKSLTLRAHLRHDERTLNDEEIQAFQSQSFVALQKIGGSVRGL